MTGRRAMLWQKRHGAASGRGNAPRAAVSPQSFPIYDKAEFLHTLGVRDATNAPLEGFGSRRGQRGI